MNFKVGILQFEPELLKKEKNLEQIKKLLEPVSADLIVLPELAVSGYLFQSFEELKKVAEDSQSGPTAKFFRELARQNDTSYVVGFAEKEADRFYNSAMLINPDGEIFVYRKTHLFCEEKRWFEPGNSGLNVFTAKKGVRVGMMICFDWIFPESARTLALRGAQIIAHPANLVLPWCQQAMITRSLENRVFSITANRIGTEKNERAELTFTGMSQIISANGEILFRCGESQKTAHVVEIYPQQADDKMITDLNHAWRDRRPDMYER